MAGKAFVTPTAAKLPTAFTNIAVDISKLRVSK